MDIDMSASELSSYEPATGALFWKGPLGDVDAEIAIARENWADWAGKSITVRMETMRRFANIVRSKAEDLTDCISRETGKPLWESRTEIEALISKVEISIAAYNERTSQRRIEGNMGVKSALRHKPHGVLGVIGPFNAPMNLPNSHILPALLAGNGVVFKPSEKAPLSGAKLVECFHAAGIPSGVLRLVIGGMAEGKQLAAHRDIDGLLFTGSAHTGVGLSRQFADTPGKILALEMGGNNPVIVWDAADIHAAATIVVQSAFLSAGQRCTAARRLIVQDGTHHALIDEIKKIADRLIVGEPHSSPAPYMGPVIDNEAADGLQESFLSLMMKGGQPIKRLDRPVPDRPFLSPAVIDMTGVKDRPDIELFGPILQVIRVPDFDSALIEANNTRYGLSASLIGGSPQLYDRFWANIRAGVVNWNRPTNGATSNGPNGGVGLSGNHRPSAFYAADYCAYPVISTEEEQARASIGIGLRDFVVNS
jgi:succinylglutamic semialdehyde dehydrogenase